MIVRDVFDNKPSTGKLVMRELLRWASSFLQKEHVGPVLVEHDAKMIEPSANRVEVPRDNPHAQKLVSICAL